MEEDLAQLIFSYLRFNKDIDETFINKAIRIILRHFPFKAQIEKVKTSNCSNDIAVYNPFFKTICINYRLIKQDEKKYLKSNMINLDSFSSYKYINLIKIILHEFEHAKQNNTLLDTNTIEGLILSEELKPMSNLMNAIESNSMKFAHSFIEILKLYRKYINLYEYCPSERLAEINASLISFDIANILNDKQTSKIMLENYYHSLLRGYNVDSIKNKSNIPTKYYLDSLGFNNKWDKITELSRPLNKFNEIKLGLQSSSDELNNINNKCNELSFAIKKTTSK